MICLFTEVEFSVA
jgi:hypothetical protein